MTDVEPRCVVLTLTKSEAHMLLVAATQAGASELLIMGIEQAIHVAPTQPPPMVERPA
jgi:hypothetical protein